MIDEIIDILHIPICRQRDKTMKVKFPAAELIKAHWQRIYILQCADKLLVQQNLTGVGTYCIIKLDLARKMGWGFWVRAGVDTPMHTMIQDSKS